MKPADCLTQLGLPALADVANDGALSAVTNSTWL